MVALALYAEDAAALRRLEQLVTALPGVALVGSADRPPALAELLDRNVAELVLAEPPPTGVALEAWLAAARRSALILLVDDAATETGLDALYGGAQAVLPRQASAAEIAVAIDAAMRGFSLVPRPLLRTLLQAPSPAASVEEDTGEVLTPRELEVLTAIADGASNKMIARRLGISFHTVKFHVASILEKLGAESRTEALAQAARRGLIML